MKEETVARLRRMLAELEKTEPRRAAEVAYALAQTYRRLGNNELAVQYGRKSLALFDKCRMETEEDCACRFITLGDIALPDLIHQGVVRERLQPLQV